MAVSAVSPLRRFPRDGSLLLFDRDQGWNALVRSRSVRALTQCAPRVVQFGLTNRCNLRCGFCYRDRTSRPRWTGDTILHWARVLSAAGVLELAFGEGEPLLFQGFAALLRDLRRETELAVGFTTNGLLLGEAMLHEITGCFSQIRVSYYEDNNPLETIARLARREVCFGVNLLVTPARLPRIATLLERVFEAGCQDVLLLPYLGSDPSLHLSPDEDRRFARVLLDLYRRYGDTVQFKLGICFGHRLQEVPQLRIAGDCGAGDDFVALDSGARLRACSFHAHGEAVESPEELLDAWRRSRKRGEQAGTRGCARPLPEDTFTGGPELLVFRAFASNNSSSYTIVGEFSTAESARAFLERLTKLKHDALERPEAPVWKLLGYTPRPAPTEAPWSDYQRDWPSEESALARTPDPEIPFHTRTRAGEVLGIWPDELFVVDRRVVLTRSQTLYGPYVLTALVLKHHGRLLLAANSFSPYFLYGFEPGDRWPQLEPLMRRTAVIYVVVGARVYSANLPGEILQDQEIPMALAPLFEPPRSAVDLERVIRRARDEPPRSEEGESTLMDGLGVSQSELSSPEGASRALKEAGWSAPARWPRRLIIERLGRDQALFIAEEPLPPAFFYLAMGGRHAQVTTVPGRTPRLQVCATSLAEPSSLKRLQTALRKAARRDEQVHVDESEHGFGFTMDFVPAASSGVLRSLLESASKQGVRYSLGLLPRHRLEASVRAIDAILEQQKARTGSRRQV